MHRGNDAARELITLPHSNDVAWLQRLQIHTPDDRDTVSAVAVDPLAARGQLQRVA